jgi:hypothetical protein
MHIFDPSSWSFKILFVYLYDHKNYPKICSYLAVNGLVLFLSAYFVLAVFEKGNSLVFIETFSFYIKQLGFL